MVGWELGVRVCLGGRGGSIGTGRRGRRVGVAWRRVGRGFVGFEVFQWSIRVEDIDRRLDELSHPRSDRIPDHYLLALGRRRATSSRLSSGHIGDIGSRCGGHLFHVDIRDRLASGRSG